MTQTTIKTRMQQACKTEAQWDTSDPVIPKGVLAFASDKYGMHKIGDGTKTWKQLNYCKADLTDPVATGSFSLNRNSGSIVGDYSTAEGNSCTASGRTSHAEGNYCKALGGYSHAEGTSCVVSGEYSHAEGSSCTVSGNASHAEGATCVVSGHYSHAEGKNSIASGNYQHVQGKYNEEDLNNKYAHIVGGGSGTTSLKNIHTLDWDGNAYYAGDVTATKNGKSISLGSIFDLIYPIGSIYMSVKNVNPGTLFNGTWSRFADGRVLVGVWDGDASFNAPEKTGGERNHVLTATEMPRHNHAITTCNGGVGGGVDQRNQLQFGYYGTGFTTAVGDAGNGGAHNNMQPYITCYIWKRIS